MAIFAKKVLVLASVAALLATTIGEAAAQDYKYDRGARSSRSQGSGGGGLWCSSERDRNKPECVRCAAKLKNVPRGQGLREKAWRDCLRSN